MTAKPKRLMVLGGGPYQLPIIRRALERGCHVITADYLPDNPGHRLSHEYVNISTTDVPAVLDAARALSIDGITTYSDTALPTVIRVAEALGLPGPGVSTGSILLDKARFREFQRQRGLPAPEFAVLRRAADIARVSPRLKPPLMVKPSDRNDSRGITKVSRIDGAELADAFASAHAESRTGLVCVEEFVEGTEVSVEAFLQNGTAHSLVITRPCRHRLGHSLPTDLSTEDQRRVAEALLQTCRLVGYSGGPLNCDIIFTATGETVIDIAPRMGGNGIHQLVERGTGFSPIDATILCSLGESVAAAQGEARSPRCGSLTFGSAVAGVLKSIATPRQLTDRVPEVFDYSCHHRPGDPVRRFACGADKLGIVVFDLPQGVGYREMVSRIEQALSVEVTPAGTSIP